MIEIVHLLRNNGRLFVNYVDKRTLDRYTGVPYNVDTR